MWSATVAACCMLSVLAAALVPVVYEEWEVQLHVSEAIRQRELHVCDDATKAAALEMAHVCERDAHLKEHSVTYRTATALQERAWQRAHDFTLVVLEAMTPGVITRLLIVPIVAVIACVLCVTNHWLRVLRQPREESYMAAR